MKDLYFYLFLFLDLSHSLSVSQDCKLFLLKCKATISLLLLSVLRNKWDEGMGKGFFFNENSSECNRHSLFLRSCFHCWPNFWRTSVRTIRWAWRRLGWGEPPFSAKWVLSLHKKIGCTFYLFTAWHALKCMLTTFIMSLNWVFCFLNNFCVWKAEKRILHLEEDCHTHNKITFPITQCWHTGRLSLQRSKWLGHYYPQRNRCDLKFPILAIFLQVNNL